MTLLVPQLLSDASYRASAPAAARSLRVATLEQLAHLDPDLDSLEGDDADFAERERARVEARLYFGGPSVALKVVITDGGFPASPRENLISRARLQAHRDTGMAYVFVRFASSDPTPLWVILGRPPFSWPLTTPVHHARRDVFAARREARWIR